MSVSPQQPTTTQQNVELVESFYADVHNLLAAMTLETRWNETAGLDYGGSYTGPEEIYAGVFRHIEEDWQDFGATPERVLASGDDLVISVGRYHGTYKKTNKTMNAEFAHFYRIADGKLAEFTQYADSATYNSAMR